jgi:hypothetical protein
MAYKPLPITIARNLLYLVKVMNEAIHLNHPKSLSEAELMLSNFEVITSEAIREAEAALPAEAPAFAA